ncbi:hypothetical protein EMPS_01969 [Entomortierella parvispora]|uniref:Uncharacterized protein n=1 Tax=Entomortierella parvispora TaxID=205924 RepID=A0A9P3LTA9_9FUNG|nr:hypothetical protein EMPS_01969 [Entomortierella parvispora]
MSDIPLGHSGIPTTTGQPEVAPENLLTRGYAKRSLAALEAEFVESNDINAMAPSSAVLQSDYLIMDDAHNLGEKVDMSESVAPLSTTTATVGPAAKRPRYTAADHESAAVSEADFAQLKPVIQPRSGSKSPSSGDHATMTTATPTTRPRASSISWARSVSDLVPPPSQLAPICLDEEDAAKVLGRPMDSSSARFTSLGESQPSRMDIDSEEGQQGKTANSSSPGVSSSSSPSLFIPSHQSHGGQQTEHRRSISGASASSSSTQQGATGTTFGYARKGTQPRPVLIKIIDDEESESIRERAKRDSITQGLNDTELNDLKQTEKDEEEDLASGRGHDHESDSDVALPKEDPIVHDWDREELDDESDTSAVTSTASSPRPMSQRRRSIESDIRRASGQASSSQHSSSLRKSHVRDSRRKKKKSDDDDDDYDDDRDSLLDPEREVAMMSEDQEAELHNMHLRLENQRDFQDAAGLDLGEEDAQAVNEEGQYGGILEDDDEGEDYWENR